MKKLIIAVITLAILFLATSNMLNAETLQSKNLAQAKAEALEKQETILQQKEIGRASCRERV